MRDADELKRARPEWQVSFDASDSEDESGNNNSDDSGIFLNVVRRSTGSIFEAYNLKSMTPTISRQQSREAEDGVAPEDQTMAKQSFLSNHPIPMEYSSSGDSVGSAVSGVSPGHVSRMSHESVVALRGPDPSQVSIVRIASTEVMDLKSIAHSFFSYSYSYSLPEFVRVRVHSMIKLVERAMDEIDSETWITDDSQSNLSQDILTGKGRLGAVDALLKFVRRARVSEPGTAFDIAHEGFTNKAQLESCLTGLKMTAKMLMLSKATEHAPPLEYQAAIPVVGYDTRNSDLMPQINSMLSQNEAEYEKSDDSLCCAKDTLRIIREKLPEYCKQENASKLVLTLSMPFLELTRAQNLAQCQPKRPSMLRRATSMISVPALREDTQNPAMKYTCDPTPMFQYFSKKSLSNALFTTSATAPYTVLSLNDMACLLFGTSQSSAMNKSVLEFFDECHRDSVHSQLTLNSEVATKSDGILICGNIFDILKGNGTTGVASICVEKSHSLLVWAVDAIEAHIEELPFSPAFDKILLDNIKCPELDIGSKEAEIIDKVRGYANVLHPIALKLSNRLCPALISKHVSGDSEQPLRTLRVRLMLGVATSIFVDEDLKIKHYNSTVLRNMLGYDRKHNFVGHHINDLIPDFSKRLQTILSFFKLKLTSGLILPEHLFRQQASQSSHEYFTQWPHKETYLQNYANEKIWADIQVRVINDTQIVVWISYSRPRVDKNTDFFPSQLELLSESGLLPTSASATDVRMRKLSVSSEASSDNGSGRETESDELPFPVGSRRRELKFDQLEILETLGAGAYGRVVLARSDLILRNRVFALKSIVKDRILVDTWTRDRVLGTVPNEIKVLNDLRKKNHPNIIRLLDFFEDSEYYHVAMICHGNPGIDLFDFIEQNEEISTTRAKHIYRQVVSAISYLHTHGIVHRDLKDENIMIDQYDCVKVIDFGSAAYVRQGPFDIFVGTVDYAAPEVLKGLAFEGPQQDVWALGILLYTLLQKEYPFFNVDEVMEAQLTLPDDIDSNCAKLLHSLLEKDYNSRPTAANILESEWLANDIE